MTLFTAVVFLSFFAVRIGLEVHKDAQHAASVSFLASIETQLKMLSEDFFSTEFSSDWTLLGETDYQNVAKHLSSSNGVDKKHGRNCINSVLKDIWGKQIVIGVIKIDKNDLDFVLWSKGRDGKSGTCDDIIHCPTSINPEEIQKQLMN